MMPFRTLRKNVVLFFVFGITSLAGQVSAGSPPSTVTISTFNVRMYGYRNDSEVRDPVVKKFIFESIPTSDIMVFEEIMDVPRFKKLLPASWSCLSYDHLTPHQFVLLCHSPRFSFKREAHDDNDVIDEVGGPRGTLRPAVTAIVADASGNPLFRMVAVHLKALPDYSSVRIDQAQVIAKWLSQVEDPGLPVVMTGDFNTYTTQMNGQQENDIQLIQRKLDDANLKMNHVPNNLFTFKTKYGASQFDHFYISSSLRLTRPLKIFEVCNSDSPEQNGNMNLEYYNNLISDHCPVTAEIAF